MAEGSPLPTPGGGAGIKGVLSEKWLGIPAPVWIGGGILLLVLYLRHRAKTGGGGFSNLGSSSQLPNLFMVAGPMPFTGGGETINVTTNVTGETDKGGKGGKGKHPKGHHPKKRRDHEDHHGKHHRRLKKPVPGRKVGGGGTGPPTRGGPGTGGPIPPIFNRGTMPPLRFPPLRHRGVRPGIPTLPPPRQPIGAHGFPVIGPAGVGEGNLGPVFNPPVKRRHVTVSGHRPRRPPSGIGPGGFR